MHLWEALAGGAPLWEALVGGSPAAGTRWEIPGLMAQRADDAMHNAWVAQQNYAHSSQLAALERQAWRASVSQNWLNAMIDVELGI